MNIFLPFCAALLLTCTLLAAGTPEPDNAEAAFQQTQVFQKHLWENFLEEMQPLDADHPSRALADALSLVVVADKLVLRTRLPSTPGRTTCKVRFDNSPDWSLLSIVNGASGKVPTSPEAFSLVEKHFDAGRSEVTEIDQHPDGSITLTHEMTKPGSQKLLQLQIQPAAAVATHVGFCRLTRLDQRPAGGLSAPPLTVSSDTFGAFVYEHAAETNQYLRPLFHQLNQDAVMAPDSMLLFEVFSDQWAPDPALTARVHELIAKLGGGDFHSRSHAEKELSGLGKSAVVILLHLDRTTLNPEQNARIDQVLAPYHPVSAQKAEALRSDPAFLLNCLYSDDEVIRKSALAELKKVSKLNLDFDPAADADARNAVILPLLKQLLDAKVIVPKA